MRFTNISDYLKKINGGRATVPTSWRRLLFTLCCSRRNSTTRAHRFFYLLPSSVVFVIARLVLTKSLLNLFYSGLNMKNQSLNITEATQSQRARRQWPKEHRTTLADTVKTQRVHTLKRPKELTAKRTRSRTRTSVIWRPSRLRLDAELRLRQIGGTLTHWSSAVEAGEGTMADWGLGRSCM